MPIPVILLAYSNNQVDPAKHLRNLVDEVHESRAALDKGIGKGWCQVEILDQLTLDRLLDALQTADYRDRIAVLHFAGHAGESVLELETATGKPAAAHAAGLADVLKVRARQGHPLPLVFLNGCDTDRQVPGLLAAGCQVVIATVDAIDDGVAKDLAVRFYKLLGRGDDIESAFEGAVAAIRSRVGTNRRALYWPGADDVEISDRIWAVVTHLPLPTVHW